MLVDDNNDDDGCVAVFVLFLVLEVLIQNNKHIFNVLLYNRHKEVK